MSDLPQPMIAYSAGGSWTYTDRTGTRYQQIVGRQSDKSAWGLHIWRTPPNGKSELLMFLKDCNGGLLINNRQLMVVYCDASGRQHEAVVPGFIYWDDTPSSTIVNVNEAQVAVLKQENATTRTIADSADSTARFAVMQTDILTKSLVELQKKVNALQQQVETLQSQQLTQSQVEDIVWAKIRDMNYLYRLAFIEYPRRVADPEINAYVTDLCTLIRKVN